MSRVRIGHLPLRLEALEDRTLLTTITWINSQGGSWNVANNWDLNRLPAAGDAVVIPALASGVSVMHASGNDSVQSVTSGGNITLAGGTLQVTNGLQVSADRALTLQGGTLANTTVTGGSLLVFTSAGGVLTSDTINGVMDLSQQQDANVTVSGGLVLNGTMYLGNTAGTTYGRINFADNNSLTGNATVVFGGAVLSANSNYLGVSTIGAGVLIHGKNGRIAGNSGLVNQGTINVDTAGGIIAIGNGGDVFTNQGVINISAGTLEVDSNLTLAGLGTIKNSGGTVLLTRTLDLGGGTLTLNATTGSWTLYNGTIKNGTLNESGGALLIFPESGVGETLTNMTVNGDLDLSQGRGVEIFINGGLVLNGTLYLGNAAGTTNGFAVFGSSTTAAGSLTGNATVVFGGATGQGTPNELVNRSNLTGAAGTLTIGPGVTLRGKNGQINAGNVNGSLLNLGTINADTVGGTIQLVGTGSLINQGTITATAGTLSLNGNLTLAGLGTISSRGGPVNLVGTLDLGGGTLTLNNATGSWNLVGGTLRNGTLSESSGALLVYTSTGGVLTNVMVNGDMDLSQQPNANVRVNGVLTLNGTMYLGKADGSTSGQVNFNTDNTSNFNPPTLTGNATVVFGGATGGNSNISSNYLENNSSGSLIIEAMVTLRGKFGAVYSTYTNNNNGPFGSVVNRGTINVDTVGGLINVGGGKLFYQPSSNPFINQGTINVSAGTLGLYGSLTLAGLGTINHSGGTIKLGGTLDLGGGTLALTAATGSWNLDLGTIKNGTLSESGGALLVFTADGGTLTNMTINGDMDLSQQQSAQVRIYGGLVLNGTMYLGNSSRSTGGIVYFGDNTSAAGSLTGNATVVFDGVFTALSLVAGHLVNASNLPGAAGTLTLGPGVYIHGKYGSIGSANANTSLVNQGTISADAADIVTPSGLGTITIGMTGNATFTNTGTLSAQNGGVLYILSTGAATFVNTGTLSAQTGGKLSVPVALMLGGSSILSETFSSAMEFKGNLLASITNPAQFNPQGKVTLNGSGTAAVPQLLETMSRDFGISAAAYNQNYAYGTLALDNNTYVKLVDQAHNSSGSGPEAVYTIFLSVPTGTTLDLGGLHLYARSAQIRGTVVNGSITLIPDSGPLPLGIPTPGMISAVGEVDDWTFFGITGGSVTVTVNPGSSGTPAPFTPQLTWAQVQLLDFRNNVLATASDTTAGAILTLSDVPLAADGVYTIRITAAPGHAASTGNYIVTATLGRSATATMLSSSVSASEYGQVVTFTASVTSGGNPVGEGTVTFREGGTILAGPVAVDVTGHASFTTSLLAVAGSPHVITASYSGSLSYDTSVGMTNLTVNKAHLTVTASNPSRLYGDANPPFSATITGFKNGETLATSGVTGTPSLTSPATPTSPVGYYTVTATLGSLAAANYDFVFVNGTLAVYPAHLIVMADNASRPYGAANPIFTATFTGFKNGETLATSGVSGSPSLTTTATTASPPGSYVIRATLGSLTASNYDFSFMNGTLTVTPAPLSATGVDLTTTAGAPFRGVVASFVNVDPFGGPSSYTATINWGDGSTSLGLITDNGDRTLSVSGSHTFADPASDTVQVLIQHRLGYTISVTTTATATVASLGLGIEAGQSARAASWRSDAGLELIRSFNGGASSTVLANWLAATFPNLYGTNAGAHNLTGKTNADVAAFFVSLFDQPDSQLDAEVLTTALNVYATTLSLGGTLGQSYGFAVSDTGLGARLYNVGLDGAAFAVANDTTLNVYQLLLAVNSRAVHGVLYDSDEGLRQMAYEVFEGINQAGGL